MKVYTYSQARQQLAKVLQQSDRQRVLIRRRGGQVYAVTPVARTDQSPLDVPCANLGVTTKQILAAIQETRRR